MIMRSVASYDHSSCSPKSSPRSLRGLLLAPACTQNVCYYTSPRKAGGPLSLQDMCWRTLKDHITTSNILDLLKFAEQVHLPVDIHGHCMRYVTQAYRILRERLGKAELAKALDPAMMKQLEAAVVETERLEACKARMMLGRVVEAAPPPADTVIHEPSVGGHPVSYLHEALVSGVSWPQLVDPTAREKYLCASDFLRLFGMPWAAYVSLPPWKRTALKQQHRLF